MQHGEVTEYLRQADRRGETELVLLRGYRSGWPGMYAGQGGDDSPWTPLNDSARILSGEENLDTDSRVSAKIVSTGRQGLRITRDWYFKFFNQIGEQSRIDKLKKQIPSLDAEKLLRIVEGTDNFTLQEYKQLYSTITAGNSVNNSSIVTYHGPIADSKSKDKRGTLITGDIDLNQKNVVDEIYTYFAEELAHIGLFSLPHHGSKDNWCERFVQKLGPCSCFASTYSYYPNRVNAEMQSDLRKRGIYSRIVDENNHTALLQQVSRCDWSCSFHPCDMHCFSCYDGTHSTHSCT